MDGRRFDSHLPVVLVGSFEYVPFEAGDPFRDGVVHAEVRERLELSRRLELAVAEHCGEQSNPSERGV